MSATIITEIQALQRMSVAQLRVRWLELYGEESRSRNRTYLWRRLAWRIQEVALGGLREETTKRILELAPTTFQRSQVPPLWTPALGEGVTPPGPSLRRDARLPSPGSTIVRKYKGDDIRVLVLDDGFEWNGRRFNSLSEVAFAVTGSHWSGPLFFGLRDRKR